VSRLQKKGYRITPGDGVLLLFFACVSLYSFFFVKNALPQGSEVRIEVEGALRYTLPLSTDTTVAVDGPIGKTIVEIHSGKVRIKESPCHNKLCVSQGWTSSGAVVCLPNRVVVLITGPAGGNGLDGITG
jgi:hypothetical protein